MDREESKPSASSAGERDDDSAQKKEYVDAFVPPEGQPHCAPLVR